MVLLVGLVLPLTGCSVPRVSADDRLFLPLQAEVLDRVVLPKQSFEGVPVGGLSAIAYDRLHDRFYVLSDDRSVLGPARFYTWQIPVESVPRLDATAASSTDRDRSAPTSDQTQGERLRDEIQLGDITITAVTTLKDETGTPYPPESIDPEGLVLTPNNTVWVASEGNTERGVLPEVSEYDLATGVKRRSLPLPSYYLPAENPTQNPTENPTENPTQNPTENSAENSAENRTDPPRGMRTNLGFEALAINPTSAIASPVEPYRLFMATESNLAQDVEPEIATTADRQKPSDPDVSQTPDTSQGMATAPRSRFLHFLIGDGPPFPISEHLYPIDPDPPKLAGLDAFFANGLVELVALDQGGHFLSLERTFGANGFGAKLFQVAMGAATDTAGYTSYRGELPDTEPARKTLLLDLGTLDTTTLDRPGGRAESVRLDNLEGMTLGPRLPDGSQSLILISDDNFRDLQQTQIWLVRLVGRSS